MDRNIKSIQNKRLFNYKFLFTRYMRQKKFLPPLKEKHSKTYNAIRWVKITNKKKKGNPEGNQKHRAP